MGKAQSASELRVCNPLPLPPAQTAPLCRDVLQKRHSGRIHSTTLDTQCKLLGLFCASTGKFSGRELWDALPPLPSWALHPPCPAQAKPQAHPGMIPTSGEPNIPSRKTARTVGGARIRTPPPRPAPMASPGLALRKGGLGTEVFPPSPWISNLERAAEKRLLLKRPPPALLQPGLCPLGGALPPGSQEPAASRGEQQQPQWGYGGGGEESWGHYMAAGQFSWSVGLIRRVSIS